METNYKEYLKQKEDMARELSDLTKEMKVVANRIFTSPDGRRYARQMLKACDYFGNKRRSADELQYITAQRDFVTTFLINLVKKETLLDILGDKQ